MSNPNYCARSTLQPRLFAAALPGIAAVALGLGIFSLRGFAQSVYSSRPDDPLAVYLTRQDLGAEGNGVADDSAALQRAIDRVQQTTHHGVLFIPEGRYRLAHTVNVWAGIRLIGYGATRPVFLLGRNTPGFAEGSSAYMLWFTDERLGSGQRVADASEFTFYSALSNIDFEIEPGNSAAVAIRFNVAQHSFISHARFRLGSARAAIEAVGNQASDLEIEGGRFGILTGKTSPAWQFLLMDSSFRGQQVAAISTHDAGFTLIRDRFDAVPVAIQIPSGEVEQLYGRDLRMTGITEAAVQLGDVLNLRSEVNLENIACSGVKQFAEGVGSLAAAPAWPRSSSYIEEHFSVGLEIEPNGRERGLALHHRERMVSRLPADVPTDIPSLPPVSEWRDVHALGVKGDGGTDDTAALQKAIETHRVLFLPAGSYRLSASLRLRAGSVLIGLHPFSTQLTIADADPAFAGTGPAIPLLVSPPGGSPIVTGIGISTGNANPRAAGIEWLSGAASLLDDVCFFRGRPQYVRALAPAMPTPRGRNRAPMQLDSQYPSLWIHDGAAGVFRGIWSHAGTAQAGLLIENTSAPGVVYQFSCEHHMAREVRLAHVSGWKIFDLQTEEERPEGADAVAVELESCRNLLFANTYMYRVSRNVIPKRYAVVAHASDGIAFVNVKVFSQTRLAFDNAVFASDTGVAVRAHDFAQFVLSGSAWPGAPLPLPRVFAEGAALRRVAGPFSNAAGLVSGPGGVIYFTDAAMHRVYSYSEGEASAKLLAETAALSPQVLGFAAPSTLLAVNNEKSVSAIDIGTGVVSPVKEAETPRSGGTLLLPVGLHNELVQLQWMLGHVGYTYRPGSNTARRSPLQPEPRGYFYAPDSDTAIMAGGTWRPLLQSSQLAPFKVGSTGLIVSEDDARTYRAVFASGEKLTTSLFAQRGGTAVVSDRAGNVYIAGSQLYVYDRHGRELGAVEIPERPTSLAFGRPRRTTLYIGARTSLYAIETALEGE